MDSKKAAFAAHRERLARIAARAKDPRRATVAEVDTPPSPSADPVTAWVKRQLEIHPPVKKPWFSVEKDLGPAGSHCPRIQEIQAAVAKHYRVRRFDIISSRRTADIVRPRQVACYLAKALTLRSLPEIGRRFGGRDHTTVLHAVHKIAGLIKTDPDLASDVDQIKASIMEASA